MGYGPSNFLDGYLVYVSTPFKPVKAEKVPVTGKGSREIEFLNIFKL